jgi:hypothetical protein
MPQVKRFASAAERLRAHREKMRGRAEAREPVALESARDDLDVQIAREVQEARTRNMLGPPRQPTCSEDDYVRLLVRGVRDPARLKKAQHYARWRYRGFCAGIVGSLV